MSLPLSTDMGQGSGMTVSRGLSGRYFQSCGGWPITRMPLR
jgi:hypothetical protein